MSSINDELIVREAQSKLDKLLLESDKAEKEKEIRDLEITKAKAVIDLFSKPKPSFSFNTEHFNMSSGNGNSDIAGIYAWAYDPKATWADRIKSYIKHKNKVITIADMVEAFKIHVKDKSEDKLLGAISNNVSTMVKKELLKIYKPPIKMKGFYYGNPLWFNGEELKEEYLPNVKAKLLW